MPRSAKVGSTKTITKPKPKKLNARNSRNVKRLNKNSKNLKTTKKPERQSERIKNQKLGVQLPKIDFDKHDLQFKKNVITKKLSKVPSIQKAPLLKKVSTSSDIAEIQKKYYNPIATDQKLKKKLSVNLTGYEKDKFGNLAGNNFDLAMDNGFKGRLIAVLQLYNGEGFDFRYPKQALEEKGFKIHRWDGHLKVPDVNNLRKVLSNSCQLWIISNSFKVLSDEHLEVIKEFFDNGRGVYIWGDNKPYYFDANRVALKLFNGEMSGNVPGGKVCQLQKEEKKCGLNPNHLISTGIDNLYEGVTIATIHDNPDLEPLFYGSVDNVVIAVYDKYGKRAILDGGCTRLFVHWDSAGTGRYVKNAAAFLANIENFG